MSTAVLALTTFLLVFGAWRIGVTWDESYHVERWQNFTDNGWYVIDAQSKDGQPFSGVKDQYVYGPATMLVLHGFNLAFGIDSSGTVATTADGYLGRHLAIALIALIGLLGVAKLGRLVLGRWDWGVVSAAVLASVPLWTGHAMFNLKDVPVATGYIWLTVGLCLVARRHAGSVSTSLGSVVAIAGGSFLMIGTRPGMWTAAFASAVALLIATVYRISRQQDRTLGLRWRLMELGLGFGAAYVGLLALYPKVFDDPLNLAYQSAATSANFLDIKASRAFVPVHVLLQMPLLVLAFILIGIAAALLRMKRTFAEVDVVQVQLTLIGVQLLTLPLITVVHRSALYSDLRQLLFATPAAAVLGAVGIATMVERARSVDRIRPGLVAGVASAALVLPVIAQGLLFPYGYTSYNALGELADTKPNTEYYRGSGRELLAGLPPTGRVVCSPVRTLGGVAMRVSFLDGAQDCRSALTSPIAAFADEADGTAPALGPDEFWIVMFGQEDAPKNCDPVRTVERRVFTAKRLSTLARCTVDLPTLTQTPLEFGTNPSDSWRVIDEGWYLPSFSPDRVGFRIRSEGGSIAFLLPAQSSAQWVEVRTAIAVRRDSVDVLVNGDPVGTAALPEGRPGFLVPVAPADGARVIELRPQGGEELDLVLVALALGRQPS